MIKLAVDRCKKEDTWPSHSVLLTTNLVPDPTQVLALALTDRFPNVVGVSRRDDDDQGVTPCSVILIYL